MKDFKDNLDEESINEASVDRFASSPKSRTFGQKVRQVLSRYSLLLIVGGAALSITVLHFQGKYLLQALRGTPLPTFWLERVTGAYPVPNKTDLYKQVLSEEAKAAWQKQITKPRWQDSYRKKSGSPNLLDSVAVTEPLVQKPVKPPVQKRRQRRQPVVEEPLPVAEVAPSFFQPVRAVSASSGAALSQRFLSCVVHGDQEVGNRKRMVLRLTKSATVNGKEVPIGTLVYGMARLAQDRIQVSVSRIGTQAVSYQVYDHTHHAGILLDEQENIVEDAAKESAYRQGQRQLGRRRSGELPTQVASDLARDLLGRARRKRPTIFLPDGYPLYLAGQ